jgi:hypothetical protein
MDITRLSRYRNNLAKVSTILSKVQSIQNLFATLQNCITIGDVGKAAISARDLLLTLQHDYYDEDGGVGGIINAVEDFAESVQRLLPTIRHKTDKTLFRLTGRKFSAVEYENILRAYMLLDDMQENMGVCVTSSNASVILADDVVDPAVLCDEDGCLEGFARRLQRYHMSDIGTCLQTAVLELLYADQHKKATDTTGGGGAIDMVDLDDLTLEELYERVTAEMFVPCIVRSCELLADVVHTNYLITQWHRLPFDERNHQEAFLHRCAVAVDESDDEIDEEGEVRASLTDSVRMDDVSDAATLNSEEEKRVDRLKSARLFAVNECLVRSRFYLWKEVELAIVDFLHNLSPVEVIDLEDFVCMLWALQTFCRLGQEFGSTTCSPLKGGIEEQSVQYARNIHVESCQLLHQMISSEPWRSVPVQLGDIGGILGVLRMTLLKQDGGTEAAKSKMCLKGMRDEAIARSKYRANVTVASRANLAAKYSSSSPANSDGVSTTIQSPNRQSSDILSPDNICDREKSILMGFHTSGNPFRCVTGGVDSAGGNNTELSQNNDDKAKCVIDTHVSYLTETLTALLSDENGGNAPSKRSQERTAAMVVTQTCLHGLSKFSGQYLQIMQLMPSAACDMFDGLCHLFDFYLYAVFTGFISPEDRHHLFSKKTRSTAPPPQQSQEFEVLSPIYSICSQIFCCIEFFFYFHIYLIILFWCVGFEGLYEFFIVSCK